MTDTGHQLTEDLTEYERFLLNALIAQEEKALGHSLPSRRRRQLMEEVAAQHARAAKQMTHRKAPRGRPRKVKGGGESAATTEDFRWRKPVSSRLLPPR